MGITRQPFQGVLNIIRFNWHFYLSASLVLYSLLYFNNALPLKVQPYIICLLSIAILSIAVSLVVSFYVYDVSDLYKLKWFQNSDHKKILNINAGFDETSEIIKSKFPNSKLTICDFYNPNKHTEVSIKRARKAYPPLTNTIQVSTDKLPFQDNSFDYALAILSAHEIRDNKERIIFFSELNRVIKPAGQIDITEHLRDLNNFLAYTIGIFHFYSKSTWLKTFKHANLIVRKEIKTTQFITTFILKANGNTL